MRLSATECAVQNLPLALVRFGKPGCRYRTRNSRSAAGKGGLGLSDQPRVPGTLEFTASIPRPDTNSAFPSIVVDHGGRRVGTTAPVTTGSHCPAARSGNRNAAIDVLQPPFLSSPLAGRIGRSED